MTRQITKPIKKYVSLSTIFIVLLLLFAPQLVYAAETTYKPDFEVQAEGVYLVNLDTDYVIYEKNAEKELIPASLVKMMTALLTVENVKDLDKTTVTAESWVFDAIAGQNASNADIKQGETLTVRQLLYAMILPSGGEATLMAAGYISDGDIPGFITMMNDKAKELNCTDTTFVDTNGLSDKNVSTPKDMYLITKAFFENSTLKEISETETYTMPKNTGHTQPYTITTTNRLIMKTSPYYSWAPSGEKNIIGGTIVGGKTGNLGTWQNFASLATKNEASYICIVMESPTTADEVATANKSTARPAIFETAEFYDWVFRDFEMQSLLDTKTAIQEVTVKYSTKQKNVKLLPENDVKALLPKGTDVATIEKSFDIPEWIGAPIKQGEVEGTVTLSLGDRVLGKTSLVASEDVSRNIVLFALSKTGDFLKTPMVRNTIIIAVIVFILFIIFTIRSNNKKKKKRQRQKERAARTSSINSQQVYKKTKNNTNNKRKR